MKDETKLKIKAKINYLERKYSKYNDDFINMIYIMEKYESNWDFDNINYKRATKNYYRAIDEMTKLENVINKLEELLILK